MPQPGKVLNYSKWDNIEISDDEDKVPASIEKDYWTRIMRSKRAERKEKFDSEKNEINKGKKFSREKIEALQRSSKKTCEEVRSQIDEADRIYKQWVEKERDLETRLAKEPLNVDTIGQVKESKTRISCPRLKLENLKEKYTREEYEAKYKKELFGYFDVGVGGPEDLPLLEEYMLKHPDILCEYTRQFYGDICVYLAYEEYKSKGSTNKKLDRVVHHGTFFDLAWNHGEKEGVDPRGTIKHFFNMYRESMKPDSKYLYYQNHQTLKKMLMERAMASAPDTHKKRMEQNPERTKEEMFNAKWKFVPKVEVPGAPMTHLECYKSLPVEWQEMVLATDMEKFATFLNGPNMEYAQMMMACGLLVCPADETDIQRAEETNTLISLSDKHSKKCPNARNAQKDNQIHDITNKVMLFDSKPKLKTKSADDKPNFPINNAPRTIDYSKWDNLNLSDDEE